MRQEQRRAPQPLASDERFEEIYTLVGQPLRRRDDRLAVEL